MIVAAFGWAAAASLLLGYRLVTVGRVSGESTSYLLLNLFGSIGLGVSTAAAHAWPSAAVNAIWLALGIGPLARAARLRSHLRPFPAAARFRRRKPDTGGENLEGLSAPGAQPG